MSIKHRLVIAMLNCPSMGIKEDGLSESDAIEIILDSIEGLSENEMTSQLENIIDEAEDHTQYSQTYLLEVIEELASEVSNEKQRGDEQFDRAEQLKNDIDALSTVRAMQAELKEAIERQAMGVITFEDVKELINNFIEADI